MQILFIHVAGRTGNRHRTNLIPNGLFGLADGLDKSGHKVTIIHKELEETLSPHFDLASYVTTTAYDLACFDLYFHYQSHSVLEAARLVKKYSPRTHILLGGLTASIFANEILENFSFVDSVLKGDCEQPILQLAKALEEKTTLAAVANLHYRENRLILNNPMTYVITPEIYKNTSYANYKLLKNHDVYFHMRLNSPNLSNIKQTYYSFGRSCPKNCSFCGASHSVEALINGRRTTFLKDASSVAADLKAAKSYGITHWNAGFDPLSNPGYLTELFSILRAENIRLDFVFDSFGLPTDSLLQDIANTFNPRPIINISPYSGSRRVRISNGTSNYTNDELINSLTEMKNHNLRCSVYFTAGLFNETDDDVEQTKTLIRSIRQKFPEFQIHAQAIEIEPFSLISRKADEHGIKNHPQTFLDYVRLHAAGDDIAYETEFFNFTQIKDIVKEYNVCAQTTPY